MFFGLTLLLLLLPPAPLHFHIFLTFPNVLKNVKKLSVSFKWELQTKSFYFLEDKVVFENRRQAAILLLMTFPYSSLIICFMFLYCYTELFVERFPLWRAAFLDIMCLRGVKGGGESSEPWDTLPTLWKAWKEDLIFDGMSHSGDRGVTASTRRCVYRLSFLSHRKGGLQKGGLQRRRGG